MQPHLSGKSPCYTFSNESTEPKHLPNERDEFLTSLTGHEAISKDYPFTAYCLK